jgi:glycerate 2-kinase
VTPDRELVASWLQRAVAAVDPEPLTKAALQRLTGPLRIISIGKAAPAMARGAAAACGAISGLCISDHHEEVPDRVELIIGDHPVPGVNSLRAGERALEVAGASDVALVSGGGSALCEAPAPGVTLEYVAIVTKALLDGGVDIEEANLVRAHLSRLKGGGLGPIATFVLSDVSAHGPDVVSSGPTIPIDPDPERVLEVLRRIEVEVPIEVEEVIRARRRISGDPTVRVLADGRTAADAAAGAARATLPEVTVLDRWIVGPVEEWVTELVASTSPGVTIAAGEGQLRVTGSGNGGRNTHAALLAATQIAGTKALFAALATDGVDGNSEAAGAIVDGQTITRGGDPSRALKEFDSARYLSATGDLLETGPTGTNVADLWLIWKPDADPEPILAP